ncbi:MAG: hypothetical protein OEU80_10885 [Deltaproteobacteria bacterium]|jgi:hypothetical protein|nr:hypothetical protein [Deltaproteobacteria bacterium]MDH3774253.1 hypothetical protein [Deltaproteobacteria bacterium]MDH3802577.1 hypothetical protein [Deltaproteobacteria bacterium]MDH3928295.1 hypothetical protein [Deltaproteobacteria bacterium]MDH3950344.1 hypothetical protein [Deltaproteobacteria bacterium]
MIETQLDKSKKLTIFTVSGTITALEFANAIRSFYAGDLTLYALWDLRNGKIESTDNDVWNLARSVSSLNLSSRRGGKTALVAGEGRPFGLARMYQLITDTMTLPFEIKVFTSIEEAHNWLETEEAPTS